VAPAQAPLPLLGWGARRTVSGEHRLGNAFDEPVTGSESLQDVGRGGSELSVKVAVCRAVNPYLDDSETIGWLLHGCPQLRFG